METAIDGATQYDRTSPSLLDASSTIRPISDDVASVAVAAEDVGQEPDSVETMKLELPLVAAADELVMSKIHEHGERQEYPDEESSKHVVPSVIGLDFVQKLDVSENGSTGYAESIPILLSGRSSKGENALNEESYLPRIEVRTLQTGAIISHPSVSGWNRHAKPCKTRAEIIADNAHPKCFGIVGASGLSRKFTSGSFCPEMSSLPMAVKNVVKLPAAASLVVHNLQSKKNKTQTIERSTSMVSWSKSRRREMPAIRTSKVSLFSRGGERVKNMVFLPTADGHREEWGKSVTVSPRNTVNSSAPRVPKLTGRYNSFVREDAEKQRGNDNKSPGESSNSDDLTPSETGVMDSKIQDWFVTGKSQHPKPKTHHGVRNKRKSRNIWDPGMQPAIHRGLASSTLKPTACVGNYMSDVTASRFPRVVIRQIVVTR